MKKLISKIITLSFVIILSLGFLMVNTFAEGEETPGTSIRLMPVSKILQLASSSTYDESFEVFNDGAEKIQVETYAAPYSYVYSNEEDLYKLGFNNENNFTQISRWISFKNSADEFVEKAVFDIEANSSVRIDFRVSTPANIPAGGQYAVIFAHALNGVTSSAGIRTEASPGIVVYGRSTEGEVLMTSEIRDLSIKRSITEGNTIRNNISASAKIKNTGNVDFTATGKLKVSPILGFGSYGAEDDQPTSRISIIPESELVLSDEWTETPGFGVFKVSWMVTAGDSTESVEKIVFLIPVWFIILIISLLTILIIWIIIRVRKRKERRSRLAV